MNEKINYFVLNPAEKTLLVQGDITLPEADVERLSVACDPQPADQVFRLKKESFAGNDRVLCSYGLKLYFDEIPNRLQLIFEDGEEALVETIEPKHTADRRCADNVLYPLRVEAEKRADYLRHDFPGIFRERLSAAIPQETKVWLKDTKRFVKEHLPGYKTDYEKWIEANEADMPAYAPIRNTDPLISILIPVISADSDELMEAVESVIHQNYPNWEICLVDDHARGEWLDRLFEEFPGIDDRIRVLRHDESQNLCQTINDAAAMAEGEYLALLEPDAVLSKDAVASVIRLLRDHPETDIIYSDEDLIDAEGRRSEPWFKPDFSPETLLASNYMSHFLTMRKDLFDQIGGVRPGFDRSTDFDLVLRASEATDRVGHIPKVLYHNRTDRPAPSVLKKEAGLRAVNEALSRREIPGKAALSEVPGACQIHLAEGLPGTVTVIIPTKDNPEVLTRCVDSIFDRPPETGFDVLIVNNNSGKPETFRTFAHLKETYQDRIRILDYPHPFNYSKINNFAARHADGEFLLFLNDDTEVISDRWMSSMARLAALPQIGAVGAKLLYPDGSIQHAGVVLGLGPSQIAGHIMTRLDADTKDGQGRVQLLTDVAAVTAACLMIEKDKFDQVGGFTEELSVNYNDIDLCLKLFEAGYRNVYDPEAVLYHFESLSRGADFSYDKAVRMRQEQTDMKKRWGALLKRDPYYSPHLSLDHADGRIRV